MFDGGRRLTPFLSVSPQVEAEDFEAIAAAGFRSVINNRPDGEAPGQLPDRAAAAAAAKAGLVYRFLPVVSGQVTDEDVAAFEALLSEVEAEGPILAYCRTGTRCSVLWALSQAGRQPAEEVLRTAADAGYDLTALRPRLEARSTGG